MADWTDVIADHERFVAQLEEEERERIHWEAEHAALFHMVCGDGAAERIARAFGDYDDLEWARLDAFTKGWLRSKGQRVVDMFGGVS